MSTSKKTEDTMNENFIITLLEKFDASSIKELSLEKEGVKISFNKNCSVAPSFYASNSSIGQAGSPAQTAQNDLAQTSASSTSSAMQQTSLVEKDDDKLFVKSPIVGTFYRAPSPDSPAYAEKGKTIKKGQPLCILEAMKMMNTLEAEYDCVIEDILASNGDLVEFDQNIFHVRKV